MHVKAENICPFQQHVCIDFIYRKYSPSLLRGNTHLSDIPKAHIREATVYLSVTVPYLSLILFLFVMSDQFLLS